jgi:hypothetical protein
MRLPQAAQAKDGSGRGRGIPDLTVKRYGCATAMASEARQMRTSAAFRPIRINRNAFRPPRRCGGGKAHPKHIAVNIARLPALSLSKGAGEGRARLKSNVD